MQSQVFACMRKQIEEEYQKKKIFKGKPQLTSLKYGFAMLALYYFSFNSFDFCTLKLLL